MNEKISELIDGRGNPDQRQDAFDRLLADDVACKMWQRYHLIGCVLRNEVRHTGADLSAHIRARLEDEPPAPAPMPAPVRPSPRLPGWRADAWKSAGMLALAASVALIAVISLKPAPDNRAERLAGSPAAGFERASFRQEFSEMLAQHGEFTSSPGLNGLIVYAKLVNNERIDR